MRSFIALAVVVVGLMIGCNKRSEADCSKVAAPVRARMAQMEKEAKTDLDREYATKFGPIAEATVVQSCKTNKWSAKAIEACSKEVALDPKMMNDCDGALSSEQLAALRKDLAMGIPTTLTVENLAGSASSAAPCKDVEVALAKDSVVVKRDTEETTKLADLKGALDPLAKSCRGTVVVKVPDDMDYQTLVTAIDTARAAGFVDIALDDGADGVPPSPPRNAPAAPAATAAVKNAPLVIVTKTDVSLTLGQSNRMPLGTVTDFDAAKLDDALKAAPQPVRDAGVFILQADASTPMKTIRAIVVSARRSGLHDILFAVQNR